MKKSQEIHNFTHIVSLEQLKREVEYEFNLVCSKDDLSQLTDKLNVLIAKKACINGTLKLQTAKQIFLKGKVTAKLIQPCSLTLEPIITNISKKILRTFTIESEKTIPIKKNTLELTEKSFDNDIILDEINLGEVLMETISLETPDYPKKSGASLSVSPINSSTSDNPFSVLRKLKQ
ncbi:DUF177 domain-containing protein [Paracoccaceae bacterium]|nr:DUF177 domain-containing protein [Paracoccaceae bacterium]